MHSLASLKIIIHSELKLFASNFSTEDHFEGDIVLDTHTADIVNGKSAYDAVKSDTRKWTGGVVPYVFASNFGKLTLVVNGIGLTKKYYLKSLVK